MEAASFRSEVLKYGVIIGMVNIIVLLAIYIIDATMLVGLSTMGISLVVNLVLLSFAGIQLRKLNGGVLSFKNAFVFIFLVVIVSSIIGMIFNILLYNVIDPELPAILTEASIEQTVAMMEKLGAPAESIDESIEQVRANSDFSATRQVTTGSIAGIVMGVIFGLICGAIAMKKPSIDS